MLSSIAEMASFSICIFIVADGQFVPQEIAINSGRPTFFDPAVSFPDEKPWGVLYLIFELFTGVLLISREL